MEEIEKPERKPLGAIGVAVIVLVKSTLLLFAPIEFVAEENIAIVRISALAIVVTAIWLCFLLWHADTKSKPVVILLFRNERHVLPIV